VGALNSCPPCVVEEIVNRALFEILRLSGVSRYLTLVNQAAAIRALWTFTTVNDRRRAGMHPMHRLSRA